MGPYMRIPDLKKIASVCAAIALWNHIDIPSIVWQSNRNEEDCSSSLEDDVKQLANELSLPESVLEQIKESVNKIFENVKNWITRVFNFELNIKGMKNDCYCHIEHISWYADGTINIKETARNLLNSFRLSEIQKYFIICSYCLDDEITRVSPSLWTNKIVDFIDEDGDPLIHYWTCYCRNELDEIPVPEGESVDSYMFLNQETDNWPAKEYFFDRLNAEDQVRCAISVIVEDRGYKYQKLLFMKLDESQLYQVYMKIPALVMENYTYGVGGDYQDLLSTWYDIRDLITCKQFVSIFKRLSGSFVTGEVLAEIWISADDDFKRHVINYKNHVLFKKVLYRWKTVADSDCSFLSVLLKDVSKNVKLKISKKDFFRECFQDLMNHAQLSTLENLLNTWFSERSQLIQFKQDFTKSDFFSDFCELLITNFDNEKLSMLEQVWHIWFSTVEEVTKFKDDFTTKGFFRTYSYNMMFNSEFSTLEELLNLCLPENGQFEQDLAENEYFLDHCEDLIERGDLQRLEQLLHLCFSHVDAMTKFQENIMRGTSFKECCEKIIEEKKIQSLKNLFRLCLPNTDEAMRFKQDLMKRKIFNQYSRWQDIDIYGYSRNSASLLKEIINICLPQTPESINFLRDSVNNWEYFDYTCRWVYWRGKFEELNDWLSTLFMSQSDLVIEYKKKIMLLPESIKECADRFFSRTNRLNEIIADAFPDVDSAGEFKKIIIFQPSIINGLQNLIREGKGLNEVKEHVDGFLTSNEDKRILKKRLIDDLRPEINEIFLKYTEFGWQSLMQWCLEDKNAVQQLKCQLPFDKIFENRLQRCIFRTYDENRISGCILKKNLDFASLDRFLKWWFESQKLMKEYKLQKIHAYEQMKTIKILLQKSCGWLFLRKLMYWFFDNDHVEIAKYKKKYSGEKIAKVMKVLRNSYFKHKVSN